MIVLGTINLPLVLGDEKHRRELYAEFTVVDIPLEYNVILGHPVLNCNDIVINMGDMCLKLSAPEGLVVVRGNSKMVKECYKHPTKALEMQQYPSTC